MDDSECSPIALADEVTKRWRTRRHQPQKTVLGSCARMSGVPASASGYVATFRLERTWNLRRPQRIEPRNDVRCAVGGEACTARYSSPAAMCPATNESSGGVI